MDIDPKIAAKIAELRNPDTLTSQSIPEGDQPQQETPQTTTSQLSQEEADSSHAAKAIDNLTFILVNRFVCPKKELKKEDVLDCKFGGALIKCISDLTGWDLTHAIFTLIIRSVNLIVVVYEKCWQIKEKIVDAVAGAEK